MRLLCGFALVILKFSSAAHVGHKYRTFKLSTFTFPWKVESPLYFVVFVSRRCSGFIVEKALSVLLLMKYVIMVYLKTNVEFANSHLESVCCFYLRFQLFWRLSRRNWKKPSWIYNTWVLNCLAIMQLQITHWNAKRSPTQCAKQSHKVSCAFQVQLCDFFQGISTL